METIEVEAPNIDFEGENSESERANKEIKRVNFQISTDDQTERNQWHSIQHRLRNMIAHIYECVILYVILILSIFGIVISLNFILRGNVITEDRNEQLIYIFNVNNQIKPCDNFYEHVCSKFENETLIPDDKIQIATYSYMFEELKNRLKQILESKMSHNDIPPFILMKRIYRTCMDIDTLNKKGLTPLMELSRDFRTWPIANESLKDFDWKDQLLEYRYIDSQKQWIIMLTVEPDLKNTTKQILELDEPVKTVKDGESEIYFEFMKNVSKLIHNDTDTDNDELLKEIVNFNSELLKLLTPADEKRKRDALYNVQTLKEINDKKYQLFEPEGFVSYVQQIFADRNENKELTILVAIDENEPINNLVPEYLEKIDKLLMKTPKRVLKNFLTWKFIESKLYYLTEEARHIVFYYNLHVSGFREREARWKECTSFTQSMVPYALSLAYIQIYFDIESKKEVEAMVQNVKDEFEQVLLNSDWMDSETQKLAIIKLKEMKDIIGYPNELANESIVIQEYDIYFKNWERDELFASMLKLSKLKINTMLKRFREPYRRYVWNEFGNMAVIDAYYTPILNAIVLPAGILRGIFFDKKAPKAINYGAIGTIISHEIIHGFDDIGSEFDYNGVLHDWWTPKTKDTFLTKKKHIIEQYFNYVEPLTGKNINGNLTLGENIADNGGILLSYRAFKKANLKNEFIDNFNCTENQLFWLSYSRMYCTVYNLKVLERLIEEDQHSPYRFRVIGPLQNSKDFSRDFKCKTGSYMNPDQKNVVWG